MRVRLHCETFFPCSQLPPQFVLNLSPCPLDLLRRSDRQVQIERRDS